MFLSIASAAVIAALFLSLSVNADRSLRNAGSNLRPYRFGYFVGLVCCLLALAALYQCAVTLRQLDSPGIHPLLLVLAAVAAAGILRRRRLGWMLLPVPVLMTAWSMAIATETPIAAHAAWAGALCFLLTSAGYAPRRWHELDDAGGRWHPRLSESASLASDRRIVSYRPSAFPSCRGATALLCRNGILISRAMSNRSKKPLFKITYSN